MDAQEARGYGKDCSSQRVVEGKCRDVLNKISWDTTQPTCLKLEFALKTVMEVFRQSPAA